MEDEQRQVAKEHMIALMQAGHSWREAATRAGIQTSRSAAYRLLQTLLWRPLRVERPYLVQDQATFSGLERWLSGEQPKEA